MFTRYLMTLMSIFALVNSQAQREDQKKEIRIRNGIRFITYMNWKEEIMDKPAETNLFIMWTNQTCTECRRGITQLSKLATLTQNDTSLPKVALIECEREKELCATFQVQQFPHMMLIKNKTISEYKGIIDAQQILQNFLLNDAYLAHIVSDSLISHVVEGEKKMFESRRKEDDSAETYWLYQKFPQLERGEKLFDYFFRTPIAMTFYYIGKDHYSKFTKVSLFNILVLLPFILVVLISACNKLLDILDPIPQLVPIPPANLKQPIQNQHQILTDSKLHHSGAKPPNQPQKKEESKQQDQNAKSNKQKRH